MLRYLLFVPIFSLGAYAQFTGLAATPDGSAVYFASRLPQRGTTQPRHGKLFRASVGRGVELVRMEERVKNPTPFPFPSPLVSTTNYYDLTYPMLNASGELIGHVGTQECGPSSASQCAASTSVFVGGSRVSGWPVSRAGKYTLLLSFLRTYSHYSVLETGAGSKAAWVSSVGSGQWTTIIANSYVFEGYRSGVAWRRANAWAVERGSLNGVRRNIAGWPHPERPVLYVAALDDDPSATAWRVLEVDGETLEVRDHGERHAETCRAFQVLAGRLWARCRVKNSEPEQLWVANDEIGTGLRPLSTESAGLTEFAVAANGRAVWYVSGRGELRRLEVASGGLVAVIGPTPQADRDWRLFPGDLVTWTGVGLAAGRLQISVGGEPVPIVSGDERTIRAVIPWEPATIDFRWTGDFEFVPDPPKFAHYAVPALVLDDFGQPVVAHADWSRVTKERPAVGGQVIHFFATGLGPVLGPVRTGEPAPVESLRPLQNEFQCSFSGYAGRPEVLFAGLAPGTLGYYQVSLRLPNELPSGDAQLYCGSLVLPLR